MKHFIAASLLSALPAVTGASTLDQFSQVLFFGDSFTDGGAAYDLAGEPSVPSGIFPNNQFTNGDVWATQLGGSYVDGTYTRGTGFGTTNFAVGGAEAVAEDDDISPDLGQQIDTFASYVTSGRVVPPNSLAFILSGFNDFRDLELSPGTENLPSDTQEALLLAEARRIGAEVIGGISGGVTALLGSGVSKVAVLGLPDLAIFPTVMQEDISDIASSFTQFFNAALQAELGPRLLSGDATYIDTFSIFNDIVANAGNLGITNPLSEPCFETIAEAPACLAGDPNSYFFFDTLHPTEVVHTAFADAVEAQFAVAPVPLPGSVGLLLAALGGLFVLRRRSSAGSVS